MEPVKVHSCGIYHPWRYRGQRNPKAGDTLSKAMMDLKDATNRNHDKAIKTFSQLLITTLGRYVLGKVLFTQVQFEVVVVPSHEAGKVSAALTKIAHDVCAKYANGTYNQSLRRSTTVASAHKDNGDRSIANHMATISVVNNVSGKVILLIDDVTTTGGSMSACYHLLNYAGASKILPIALLETANYEE